MPYTANYVKVTAKSDDQLLSNWNKRQIRKVVCAVISKFSEVLAKKGYVSFVQCSKNWFYSQYSFLLVIKMFVSQGWL